MFNIKFPRLSKGAKTAFTIIFVLSAGAFMVAADVPGARTSLAVGGLVLMVLVGMLVTIASLFKKDFMDAEMRNREYFDNAKLRCSVCGGPRGDDDDPTSSMCAACTKEELKAPAQKVYLFIQTVSNTPCVIGTYRTRAEVDKAFIAYWKKTSAYVGKEIEEEWEKDVLRVGSFRDGHHRYTIISTSIKG